MHALVVSNMLPSPLAPGRGSFVRDQVRALRGLDGVEVELFEFPPGAAGYARAARELRRRRGRPRPDIVHSHFGLTQFPALAAPAGRRAVTLHGTDLTHPRTRRLTALGLRWADLVATVSEPLAKLLPRSAPPRRAVLPCGVDLERFRPIPRIEARARLRLDPGQTCVLFPADPARPGKRFDLARQAVAGTGARLLSLGAVAPAEVPLWVNAANAVLVPSDAEGFGLAVLEALACDVPVLATPVGIHPRVLDGVSGALCAPFEADRWRAALLPHLVATDPRIAGRSRAQPHSAIRMAERVAAEWGRMLG